MMNMKVPKYYMLKNKMAEKIESEEWKKNDVIPSERELSEIYDASRITVRRAISELVSEGYLYTVQGKGTFVKNDRYAQDLFSISSCTQDIIKFGMTPRRVVISSDVNVADNKTARILQIGENGTVFSMERVYYADDDPINVTKTNIAYKYVPNIEKYDFSERSLYEVLENEYNIKITKAIRTIEAVLADEQTAKNLNVKLGVPILQFVAQTLGEVNGIERPIESFVCHYSSQKFKFYINQIR